MPISSRNNGKIETIMHKEFSKREQKDDIHLKGVLEMADEKLL